MTEPRANPFKVAEPVVRHCDCEHADHFRGNGHTYNLRVSEVALTKFKTAYGTFNLCRACLDRHTQEVR